ncbi:MAG: C45 family autoproteolytic acyltransferase/hydrolase [Candidatus Kariarchaeaceae archaeon]|jgi:isopenicillin-N N-acyltransferase-like protein
MMQVNLKGSYYNMGIEYGKMIKNKLTLPNPENEQIKWATECEPIVKKYASGLLEEIQGIADSTDISYEQLIAYLLYHPPGIGKYFNSNAPINLKQNCTVFAISGERTKDGRPIFARNYDYDSENQNYFHAFNTHPNNKLRSLGFSDHMVGRYGGVNESGLAVAITAMPFYNGKPSSGILLNIATRWMLDSFETTKEAVEYLNNIPHCEGVHYVIADKSSNIAKIETTPEKVNVIYANNGLVLATNHFVSDEMKPLTIELKEENSGTTVKRYNGVSEWYETTDKEIDIDSIKYILSDHDNAVCDHFIMDGEEKYSTIWSWIVSLGSDNIDLCVGSPCKNGYKSFKLG